MKKFARFKTLEEIERQCIASRGSVVLDRVDYDRGEAAVFLFGGGALVAFNTLNGRFVGQTNTGIFFSSSQNLDGEPWFDALLKFFYVDERPEAAS